MGIENKLKLFHIFLHQPIFQGKVNVFLGFLWDLVKVTVVLLR